MRLLFITLVFFTGCKEQKVVYQMPNGVICKNSWDNDRSYYNCSGGYRYIRPARVKVIEVEE